MLHKLYDTNSIQYKGYNYLYFISVAICYSNLFIRIVDIVELF